LLQYFPDHRYRSTFCKNSSPRLEYVCHVGTDASHMPRSMHEHDHLCELLLVSQGAGIYMIDGRRYTAQKGNLIIYNSRTVHDEFGGSGSDLVTYCIAIGGLRIDGLPADHLLPDGCCPVQPLRQHFAEVQSLFDAIEKEAKAHAEIANYLTMALVTKLAAFLREEGLKEEQQTPTLAAKARAFIDKNYKENIRLGDIAAATHTNAYYLSHLFKAEVGLSPMKYVILRRIGEAQNLLINTDMTITQIAAQVGYNNSNYFQNVFKGALGMTPGEYRRKWTV
jgi:AraC-like DNA-binding protein/mannose-6-phosphate isomerase-like protein (cupin superfamily)